MQRSQRDIKFESMYFIISNKLLCCIFMWMYELFCYFMTSIFFLFKNYLIIGLHRCNMRAVFTKQVESYFSNWGIELMWDFWVIWFYS